MEKNEKQKKNIPQNIRVITTNEVKSKEIIAKAMAEMYRRMINPI